MFNNDSRACGLNKDRRGPEQSSAEQVLSARPWLKKTRVFRRACGFQILSTHTKNVVPDPGDLC